MKWLMALMLAAAVTFGGSAAASELRVGDKIGPVWVNEGSIICNTEEEVMQAIDPATPYPVGCGRLMRVVPAVIEALSEHKFGRMTFLILKLTFPPNSRLGVQFGWEVLGTNGQAI